MTTYVCQRCKNTGRVLERYVDMPLAPWPPDGPMVQNEQLEILQRWAECPECLGFGPAFKFMAIAQQ